MEGRLSCRGSHLLERDVSGSCRGVDKNNLDIGGEKDFT